MKIKKFEADTLREAMDQAKLELGENAVIVNTRELKPAGDGHFGGRSRVELLAATDDSVQPAVRPGPSVRRYRPPSINALRTSPEPPETPPAPASGISGSAGLAGDVAALRSALESLVGEGVLVAHTRPASAPERRLREAGVEAALAAQIGQSVGQGHSVDELSQQWGCLFTCASPLPPGGGPAVLALVGPAGAGKTTTLAKLATRYKFGLHKRVAVIGCDGGRLGADGQLTAMSRAMAIPCRWCLNASEVKTAVDELYAEHDIVLIDTMGGSVRDGGFVPGLKSLLQDERIRVQMVLPSNLSSESRRQALRAFQPLDAQTLIVTKLDESPDALPLLAISQVTPIPISFTAEGTDVVAGLKEAVPRELAAAVLSDLTRAA